MKRPKYKKYDTVIEEQKVNEEVQNDEKEEAGWSIHDSNEKEKILTRNASSEKVYKNEKLKLEQ